MHTRFIFSGEEYGEELICCLSKVINERTVGAEQIVSLAILAIADLCRQEVAVRSAELAVAFNYSRFSVQVMDLDVAWKQIWRKMQRDDRPRVLAALCELLSVAADPELETSKVSALLQFQSERSLTVFPLLNGRNFEKCPYIACGLSRSPSLPLCKRLLIEVWRSFNWMSSL